MNVRGSLMCPKCGARWTLVGDKGESEGLCPCCGEVGVSKEVRHVDASESQELPPLPSEQQYIRFITRKYIDAVEAFKRSLDAEGREFVLSTTDSTLSKLRSFEGFLEKIGLPLEEEREVEDEASKMLLRIQKNIERSAASASAARDAFFQLFGSPEASEAIKEKFGR